MRCTSRKYNRRTRLGRGFTKAELKAAGVSVDRARAVGIAVDGRRKQHSEESLDRNVARVKAFVAGMVVFPLRKGRAKNGDSSAADLVRASQHEGRIMPVVTKAKFAPQTEMMVITDEMRAFDARATLHAERMTEKMAGNRKRRAQLKAESKQK